MSVQEVKANFPQSTPWRHIVGTQVRLHSFVTLVSFMLQLLYPQRKSPWYQLNKMLAGPQSQMGHFEEKKNLLLMLEVKK
jgi:hypothetical protein